MSDEVKKPGRPKKTDAEKAGVVEVPTQLRSRAFGVERDISGQWCVITVEYDVDEGVGQVAKREPYGDRLIAEEQFKILVARSRFGTQQ